MSIVTHPTTGSASRTHFAALAAERTRDNVFLGNELAVSYADLSGGNDQAWSFYTSDHLGTPRLITDITGASLPPRKYWPFGDAVAQQTSAQALRFAAMEFDAEGGTGTLAADRYYDHARSHVGGLGRFLSPDKVGGIPQRPQSWNRYAYASNNPVTRLDPNGLADFMFVYQTVQVINSGQVSSSGGLLGGFRSAELRLFGSNRITSPFNPAQQVTSGEFKTFNKLVVRGDVTNGVVTLNANSFRGSEARLGDTHLPGADVAGNVISKTGPTATTLSTDGSGLAHSVQVEQSILGAINTGLAALGASPPITIGSTISLTITGEGDEAKVVPTVTYSLFPTTYTCTSQNECTEHRASLLDKAME